MNYKKNNIVLISVMIISFFLITFAGNISILKYFVIILDLLTILLLPTKYVLQNAFFMISFPALYDPYGFMYFFNFTIFITFIKVLFYYKTIDKKFSFLLIIITFIEIADSLFYKCIDFNIISFFSLMISFMTLSIAVLNFKKLNFFEIYQSLFIGLLVSSLLAIVQIIMIQGNLNLSIYTRFIGFFRDPNYYSFFILLTGFSSFKIVKLYHVKTNFFMFILFFGFLTLSKMFLFCFSICCIVVFFSRIKIRKKLTIKRSIVLPFFITFTILVVFITLSLKLDYVNTIVGLYNTRFNAQDLTTGRLDIANLYLNAFKLNPVFLIFGASNTYYFHIINDFMRSNGYYIFKDMTTHNFYIELLASWGIIGTLIFIFAIKHLISIIKKNKFRTNNFFSDNFVIFLIIFISSFSLCFLSADCFPLIILFLLLYLYSGVDNYINE